jgi:hypothetical protein
MNAPASAPDNRNQKVCPLERAGSFILYWTHSTLMRPTESFSKE